MTTATATMTAPQDSPTLDRLATWLLWLFVASLQMSIFAADVLLSLLLVCWVALLVRDRARASAPTFLVPLIAYGAVTLASSAFALEPWTSFQDDKQLVYLLIVPMVFDLARGKRAHTVMDVIVTVAALGAAFAIVQYGLLHFDSLGKRPQGISHHYMTFSGFMMLGICSVLARLVFGARDPKAGFGGSVGNLLQDERLNHRVDVTVGLLEEECGELLRAFFRERRQG